MSAESSESFQYRYDLDGLRGIAIGLVVIYHVFVGRVSGGVDVFLLLSGYFFLGSQLRYAGKPDASLNPWWPIWRMLRRLAPALMLTVGITFILIQIFTPELMRTELTRQITATVLYYQNWELAAQNADYAAASADTSPLQHMWSMSVQGQFYILGIVFAIVLAALAKWRRAAHGPSTSNRVSAGEFDGRGFVFGIAGPVLVIVTIASFLYASRHGLFGTPENYYSTFSRTWELTLGAVLAIYGAKIKLPARLADILAVVGLILLASTGMFIANVTAYPGPLSLIPLGGAILIIIGGEGKVANAMASKSMRWLGDVAYSLYLWHWPLLILSTSYFQFDTPPWWLGLTIIALSLVLADLTHRFVEAPLRQRRKRPLAGERPVRDGLASLRQTAGAWRGVGGVVTAAAAVALLAITPWWDSTVEDARTDTLNAEQYPGVMAHFGAEVPANLPVEPDPVLVGGIMPPVSTDHCFVPKAAPGDSFHVVTKDGNPCVYGDPDGEKTVYLVGGSHAEQWSSGLDKLGKKMGFKLVPLLRQDCPLQLGDYYDLSPECQQWTQLAVQKVVDAKPDLVISNTTRPQGEFGTGPDYVPAGYIGFWQALADAQIPFLGLRDNPWGFDEQGQRREFDECYVATGDSVGCGMKRDQVYLPKDPSKHFLDQLPNMKGIDTSDWFCEETDCPVVIGNVLAYRDMHHISNAFADSAMPLLEKEIAPFLAESYSPTPGPTFPNTPGVPAPATPQPGEPAAVRPDAPQEVLTDEPVPAAPTQPAQPAVPAAPATP